jgi:pimeloyl-ACP methyl ester carboxylesterase
MTRIEHAHSPGHCPLPLHIAIAHCHCTLEAQAMNLNLAASGVDALDMTQSTEFASLLESARDLQVPHQSDVRYTARNLVTRMHRFHVLDWGPLEGPTLALLHGGHQSAHSWDLVSLSLADRFRVIAPDQRGHGDSEWARDCEYSNMEMARDFIAIIENTGVEKPIAVGHSMGGRNTLLAALERPDLFRALIIVDAGPELSDQGRRAITSFVANNEEFEDLDQFAENVRRYDPYRPTAHIERTVKYNLFKRADGKYISKCDRAPRKLGLVKSGDTSELTLEAMGGLDMPVLLVRGANSNVITPEAAERFRDALPNGHLVTVPDCGHNVHSQNTPGFLQAIEGFLRDL